VTLSRRQVQEVLDAGGLRPRRSLGQNFVVDANTVRKVARLAGVGPGARVVEIGAGLGALTAALAATGAEVVALEVDRHLLPLLRAEVAGTGVHVVEADALRVDWDAVLTPYGAGPRTWTLVANLPYNVAVPLVVRVLDDVPAVGAMVVMVQREVGERLVATPGGKAYGAVSVKVAYHASARIVGAVPATVFVPRPKVDSVLVRIDRLPAVAVDPTVVAPDRLFALVRAGFGQRRKMLRRSLAGVVAAGAFECAGVDPAARAESLSVQAWGRLAACAGGDGPT
jgi:16S rRNA (adenine1518-N6/adenine1519-N6)-dimethyltransferase